jgi:hypothetical protein
MRHDAIYPAIRRDAGIETLGVNSPELTSPLSL